MPINSTQLYVKSLIDGMLVPGNAGRLNAQITPEDPRDDPAPAAYIWPARGDEQRQAMPRVNAPNVAPGKSGWKTIVHELEIYLTWFNDDQDEQSDVSFPAVIDAVMEVYRSSADPAVVYDELTGTSSQLIDIGEKMSWQLAGVKSTADQRYLRYDALITLTITEELQS